jgi:hypothetical protein
LAQKRATAAMTDESGVLRPLRLFAAIHPVSKLNRISADMN